MMTAAVKKSAAVERNLLAKAPKAEGFTVGIWHSAEGQPYVNYVCKSCQFSTLYVFLATKHTEVGIHAWKRPVKRTRKVRADKGAVY